MTGNAEETDVTGDMHWSQRVEIIATIILSVATILTAWSVFQATKWSGVMTLELAASNAARTEYSVASIAGGQLVQVDVQLFTQWLDAKGAGNEALAAFYESRFRDEFRPAFDAWLATNPLHAEDAPETPFNMSEYHVALFDEAHKRLADADRLTNDAKNANQNGDNYTLTTVLFASVLFFAGVSSKFKTRKSTRAALVMASLFLVSGIGIVATFPVEI